MKQYLATIGLLCAASISQVRGDVYSPTAKVGEFLRQFEEAYRAGDKEWIQSAVDDAGVIEEAKAIFFGFLAPKEDGEVIFNLKAMAATENYKIPNTLIDEEIEPTIAVDFIISFTRMSGEFETTIKVPAGYKGGTIWLVGIKKK